MEGNSDMSGGDMDIERARAALCTSPIHALRELRVQRDGASLILSGRVNSFYHKQLAQEAVKAVCHELDLVNTIDVDSIHGTTEF